MISCECGISGVPMLWDQQHLCPCCLLQCERECEAAENTELSISKTKPVQDSWPCRGGLTLS